MATNSRIYEACAGGTSDFPAGMAMNYSGALRIAKDAGVDEPEFRKMLEEGRAVSMDEDGVVWFHGKGRA